MTRELNLTADSLIEFGFGTVKPEKQVWMYGEYFPYMAPTMAGHRFSILAGFGVIATNFDGGVPTSGSFASWPSAANRTALHVDPRFMAIQSDRDAAMDLLSGGHLFESMDEVITLNTDSDYAIIIADVDLIISNPIFSLPLSKDSPELTYSDKSLIPRPWTEADDILMNSSPDKAEVFRVRFNGSA